MELCLIAPHDNMEYFLIIALAVLAVWQLATCLRLYNALMVLTYYVLDNGKFPSTEELNNYAYKVRVMIVQELKMKIKRKQRK